MAMDARFEDGEEKPLRLCAEAAADLPVISALVQDAVGKVANIRHQQRRRRFSMLLYRFRWEDKAKAETRKRGFERVAAALTIDDVLRARVAGLDPQNQEQVFNLLALSFEPGEDGAGVLTLACSDGVTLAFDVECLNLTLADLTQPWEASALPSHGDDGP